MELKFSKKLFSIGDKLDIQTIDKKKNILLRAILYISLLNFLAYLIYDIYTKNWSITLIDSASIIVIASFIFLIRKNEKYSKTITYGLSTLIFVLAYFFVLTTDYRLLGILCMVFVPIPVILLLGRKIGIFAIIVFIAISLLSLFLTGNTEWFSQYSNDFWFCLSTAYILVLILFYFNETAFEKLAMALEQTAKNLTKSQDSYKSLARGREKFISLISHDLKTHIANFYSISELLQSNYKQLNDKEKTELIDVLCDHSKHTNQLLNDLLKWSTLQNEAIPYVPQPVKLEKVYREVLELFEHEAEKKNISVFLKMKSNSEVYADYDMISAILRNLFSNAIKFTPVNGEITIVAEDKDNFMEISISDNGIGIPQEIANKLQESTSVTSIGTSQESGTGIGLILVNEFLVRNNGTIRIKSTEGKGTTVTITIPLVE